ncbi:MAG: DotH/IcmK family type IV secretion protein [Gammaproteobacteria bacterium]|nr:DotH/IcmK family type IV secretion protein [Gammaproteobacteria bacterium]
MKKVLLIGTILLFSCDVTMLFAAPGEAPSSSPALGSAMPSQDQIQSQIQDQIKALQTGQNPVPTTPAAAAPVAPKNDSLPPTPFNPPAGLQTLDQQNFVPPTSAPDGSQVSPQLAAEVNAVVAQQTGQQTPALGVTQDDINDAAFHSMVQNALPMSPQQIQKLRSMYMASQFAASSTPNTPPRPTATSTFVDLSPGATPPVIRLSQGFITSLVFVDSTGAPWPIESYDIGNPSAFNIQWDKTSNTLMIQSTVLYTYGNLAVKLRGLDTPVMITLIPGQKAVDYRVDMRVQGFGPNAKSFTGSTLPESTSSDLLNVLDGVPPANSRNLTVDGGDCQAWMAGGKMYVRTRLTVLSPGWTSTLSSADGMHAYEMQPAPMLLVSQNGQVSQLKVKGF